MITLITYKQKEAERDTVKNTLAKIKEYLKAAGDEAVVRISIDAKEKGGKK